MVAMRALLFHLIMIASGAALALAFAPFNLWTLAWLALVPPLWFATADRPRWLLSGGILFGVAWAVVMLDWLVTLFETEAYILWLIIGLMCALSFGVIGYVRRVWGLTTALILAPILWVGIEFFRSEIWPLRFAWLALPYTQHHNLPFLQLASVVGVYGLSLVMVAFAATLVFALRRRSRLPFIGVLIPVGLLNVVGVALLPELAQGQLRVVGAQLEAPPPYELQRALRRIDLENPEAALVVLPEYCLNLTVKSVGLDIVRAFARERWVIVGARLPAPDGDFYSGAVALAPGGEVVFQQEKSVPVPLMIDGLPAPERRLLETPIGKVGVGLCYDMDFTFVSDDLVRQGAEFLLYPTMDHSSCGVKPRIQHASLAPLRAIENRRWVMRVASSGVSCAVDPYGRITAQAGVDAPGGLIAAGIEMRSERTLYSRLGWLIPWVCMWATGFIVIAAVATDLLVRSQFRRKLPAKALEPQGERQAVPPPDLSVNKEEIPAVVSSPGGPSHAEH